MKSETELEAIRVSGLLDKHLKRVNVFAQHALSLTVLVLILKRKSHSLSRIKREEFCLEVSFKGCPICKAVHFAWTSEYPEHIG